MTLAESLEGQQFPVVLPLAGDCIECSCALVPQRFDGYRTCGDVS